MNGESKQSKKSARGCTRKIWTEGDLAYLAEHYATTPTSEIAAALGCSVYACYGKAEKLGLRKTREFKLSYSFQPGKRVSQGTEFRKGHQPHNTGTRRPGYAPGRMKETQFRKGERRGKSLLNWRPIGTVLMDSDGYLRIKVREAEPGEATGFGNSKAWIQYHRYLWELHHGPIPPKHIVVFRDGNRANCALENLELITKAENARRNRMWNRLPRELAEVIQLTGVLKRRIRKGLNNGKENEDQRPAGASL